VVNECHSNQCQGLLIILLVTLAAVASIALALGLEPVTDTIQVATAPRVVAPDVIDWAPPGSLEIPDDLNISGHAEKHAGQLLDAELIYARLLEGRCAAVARYCDGPRQLYICQDVETGLVGGMFVTGDLVITGYGARVRYWSDVVSDGWRNCTQ